MLSDDESYLRDSIFLSGCILHTNKWKVKVLVTQSCPTLCDPMDCSPPGSSGILQVRILQWVAIPFSRGSSHPRDQTWFSCMARRFFTIRTTREAHIPNNLVGYHVWVKEYLKVSTCHRYKQFSSVQPLNRVWLFATPWTAKRQAALSTTNSQSLLKLMSTELVMPSNHLILCHLCRPLLLLPSIFPSIRVFSNESTLCNSNNRII